MARPGASVTTCPVVFGEPSAEISPGLHGFPGQTPSIGHGRL